MVWSPLRLLRLGVLAGNARGDRDTAGIELLLDLLLVLAAEAEAVRPGDVLLAEDLVGHPGRVLGLVRLPHLPLARVVIEGILAHHGHAVLCRAHRLADP